MFRDIITILALSGRELFDAFKCRVLLEARRRLTESLDRIHGRKLVLLGTTHSVSCSRVLQDSDLALATQIIDRWR